MYQAFLILGSEARCLFVMRISYTEAQPADNNIVIYLMYLTIMRNLFYNKRV
jgi:hypothetical protein